MTATRVVIAAVLLSAGCASGGPQGPNRGDRNSVTQAQLAATNSQNLYDALEKLRPEWLSSRGPTSVSNATPTIASVYMNGQMLGKIDSLREVRVLDVTSVRFWPAAQASARFGMGHPRGVIEIVTQ